MIYYGKFFSFLEKGFGSNASLGFVYAFHTPLIFINSKSRDCIKYFRSLLLRQSILFTSSSLFLYFILADQLCCIKLSFR